LSQRKINSKFKYQNAKCEEQYILLGQFIKIEIAKLKCGRFYNTLKIKNENPQECCGFFMELAGGFEPLRRGGLITNLII